MPLTSRYCVLCERKCNSPIDLCAFCAASLPWNETPCEVCALPLPSEESSVCHACASKPPVWRQAFAPFVYQDAAARWVQRLKFSNGFREGRVLAHLFADDLASQGVEADLIAPMPLSIRRLVRRGHNQAAFLARALSVTLGVPLTLNALIRSRHTRAQADLPTSARKRNISGAFASRQRLDDAHVLLVDDVMTTGETFTAATRALMDAGASSVTVCAATRTPAS